MGRPAARGRAPAGAARAAELGVVQELLDPEVHERLRLGGEVRRQQAGLVLGADADRVATRGQAQPLAGLERPATRDEGRLDPRLLGARLLLGEEAAGVELAQGGGRARGPALAPDAVALGQ